MPAHSFTGTSNNKKLIFCFALSTISLLLWLVPSLCGQFTAFDWLVVLIWVISMGFTLVTMRNGDMKRAALMHTAYFDEQTQRGYSPYVGIFECGSVQDFLRELVILFSSPSLADGPRKARPVPDDFTPSLILETSSFKFSRDGAVVDQSIRSADDVSIDEWSGNIIYARSGHQRRFFSKYELDVAF